MMRAPLIMMMALTYATASAAQPPLRVSASGGVLDGPSATTGGLAIESPNSFGTIAAAMPDRGPTAFASSLTIVVPIDSSVRWIVNTQYATPAHEPGGATRLEVGTTSGAWIGLQTGPVRADNLGFGERATMPSFASPVGRPSSAGPFGFGGGLWTEQMGVTFGTSIMAGTQRYRATHTAYQKVADPENADSLINVLDTSTTALTATTLLTRLSAQWTIWRLTTDVSGGMVSTPTVHRVGWASTSAALRLLRDVSLVLVAGTRGSLMTWQVEPAPARAYLTGGLSVGWPTALPPRHHSDDSDRSVRYWLTPRSDSGYALVIRAPGAHRVQVNGDITDWQPSDCDPDRNGRWTLARPIAPGVHQLTIRIDDGPWHPPPGAPTAASGYGDIVGVIVTPLSDPHRGRAD